jgi:hypothetical protein
VCVCVCVCACARACVCVRVCARAHTAVVRPRPNARRIMFEQRGCDGTWICFVRLHEGERAERPRKLKHGLCYVRLLRCVLSFVYVAVLELPKSFPCMRENEGLVVGKRRRRMRGGRGPRG